MTNELNLSALLSRAADLLDDGDGPNWTENPEYVRAVVEVLAPFVPGGQVDGEVSRSTVRRAVESAVTVTA